MSATSEGSPQGTDRPARPAAANWALLLLLLAFCGGIAASIGFALLKSSSPGFNDPLWWWKTLGGYGVAAVVLLGLSKGYGWLRWWMLISLAVTGMIYAFTLIAWLAMRLGPKGPLLEFLLVTGVPLTLLRGVAVALLFRNEATLWFRACGAARLKRERADF
jgi:hypothetical protein